MKGYIYQIRNRATGKLYVGSTLRPIKRKVEHFNQLRKNIHCNRKLQHAWNKYGEMNFEYSILEVVDDIETLQSIEDKWIHITKSRAEGYNILTSTALCDPESIDLRRVRIQNAIGKSFRSRPPANLKKISKEEWIENRLTDPTFCVSTYRKKTPNGKKQFRPNSKAVLQINLNGELIHRYESIAEVQQLSQNAHQFIWRSLDQRPRNLTWQKCFWVLEEVITN